VGSWRVVRGALGAPKKTNAHVHAQNPSKKHPPSSFFFFSRPVFVISFTGASQQAASGEKNFKNTKNAFWKKVHVENVL
jgi:hypothetical protein